MKMRTTLTLDGDVAVQIERLRRERDTSLKAVVNDVLRRGLRQVDEPPKKRKPFRTQASRLGPPLIDIDNVWEAIALAEGEDYK
jgi:hypothetical protein